MSTCPCLSQHQGEEGEGDSCQDEEDYEGHLDMTLQPVGYPGYTTIDILHTIRFRHGNNV